MLQKLIQQGPFNLFVGAGISKLQPAHAPLWNEMLYDFIKSMYSRMEHQSWPASSTFMQDISLLRDFNFRPEKFWEIIQRQASFDLVYQVFQVLNDGAPNLNHRLISYLFSKGLVSNVVTTNFDEYIDHEIASPALHKIVTIEEMRQVIDKYKSQPLVDFYFKIHGTISVPESLQFTLAHTSKLPPEKAQCLNVCLSDLPLLIAGYSGNDDDVMPCLREIVKQLPSVVIVVRPNSSAPIRELANSNNVTLIEADINVEFRKWIEQELATDSTLKFLLDDKSLKVPVTISHYKKAIDSLSIALIPLVISTLFEFMGNIDVAIRYANLADDICNDKRYLDEISADTSDKVLNQLSIYYAMSGDTRISAIFAKEFSKSQAFLADIIGLNLQRAFGLLVSDELSDIKEKEVDRWITAAYILTKNRFVHGNRLCIHSCWYLGRLRRKQGRLTEAVALYQEADEILQKAMASQENDVFLQETMDHVTLASFTLDYGNALWQFALDKSDVNAGGRAGQLFSLAVSLARKAGDYLTEAKGLMNLAHGNYLGGEIRTARRQIIDAENCAAFTGDSRLQVRITQLKEIICQE